MIVRVFRSAGSPAVQAIAIVAALVAAGLLLAKDVADGTVDLPSWVPFVLIAAAAMVALRARAAENMHVPPASSIAAGAPKARWVAAIGLAGISWIVVAGVLIRIPHLDGGASFAVVTVGWVAATLAWLAAVWQMAPPKPSADETLGDPTRRRDLLILTGIVVCAAAVRLVSLDSIPFTVSGDEANHGLEALKVLDGTLRNPFSTSWFSMPTMCFYYQSLGLAVLGRTALAVRLPWAVVGIISVATTFALVRRLTVRPVAIATALAVATYHYHIHYSRIGSNNIGDALVVSTALWFACRSLDGTRWRLLDWAATGVACALSLFFYPGARLAVIVVAAFWMFHLVLGPGRVTRRHLVGMAVAVMSFLVTGAPMLQYAVRFTSDFNGRMNQVGILQSGWLADAVDVTDSTVAEILFDQFRRATLAFNYYPDRGVAYGLDTPLLDPIFGTIFLFGLGYATLAVVFRKDARRLAPMVIWWWAGVLLGGVLTESPPSSPRLITLAVPTCFLLVVGLRRLVTIVQSAVTRTLPANGLVLAAIAVFGCSSVLFYFLDYTPTRVYGGAHAEFATTIAPYLEEHSASHDVVFLGPPFMYWNFPTMVFFAPDVTAIDVAEPIEEPPPDWRSSDRGLFVIVVPPRADEIELVERAYPGGTRTEIHSEGTVHGFLGSVYEVPGRH